jgi:type I restriction enzyme S subunit
MNVPKLRFPGFSGEWEENMLGDIGDFKNGLNKSKEDFGHGYPFVNLMNVFGKSTIKNSHFELVNANSNNLTLYNLKKGDVLFIRSSVKREGVGETVVVLEDLINTTFSGFLIRFRDKNKSLKLLFKKYCFKTIKFRNKLISFSTTSANTNINQESLNLLSLKLPSKPEQQKIATFLTSVDTKIEQLTKKKTLLEQYKKGVMQKIFSQEIRFKADDGGDFPDWVEKKVSELFNITRGNVLAVSKMSLGKNDKFKYPVFSSQTKNKGLTGFYTEYLFEDCITWTTDGANAGDVNLRKDKFYCTNVCGVLISDKGYVNQCIAEILNSVTKRYVSYVGNPKLMNNTMGSIIIKIPKSIKEQSKISTVFSSIDTKIEQVGKQLNSTKEFKKALLQQMFV